MTVEAQLLAAIGALWVAVTGLGGGAIAYLKGEIVRRDEAWDTRHKDAEAAWTKRLAEERAECDARITALETKLDTAAGIIAQQGVSMQKQIDAQTTLLNQQAQTIATLQALAQGDGR